MKKCVDCGCKIKENEILCPKCNSIDNEAIFNIVKDRAKNDDGKRYSLEEIRKKRIEILNQRKKE